MQQSSFSGEHYSIVSLARSIVAIEQRRLSPLEPGSEEHNAIERAEKALTILKRRLSEKLG
jgi:hypothetical protein